MEEKKSSKHGAKTSVDREIQLEGHRHIQWARYFEDHTDVGAALSAYLMAAQSLLGSDVSGAEDPLLDFALKKTRELRLEVRRSGVRVPSEATLVRRNPYLENTLRLRKHRQHRVKIAWLEGNNVRKSIVRTFGSLTSKVEVDEITEAEEVLPKVRLLTKQSSLNLRKWKKERNRLDNDGLRVIDVPYHLRFSALLGKDEPEIEDLIEFESRPKETPGVPVREERILKWRKRTLDAYRSQKESCNLEYRLAEKARTAYVRLCKNGRFSRAIRESFSKDDASEANKFLRRLYSRGLEESSNFEDSDCDVSPFSSVLRVQWSKEVGWLEFDNMCTMVDDIARTLSGSEHRDAVVGILGLTSGSKVDAKWIKREFNALSLMSKILIAGSSPSSPSSKHDTSCLSPDRFIDWRLLQWSGYKDLVDRVVRNRLTNEISVVPRCAEFLISASSYVWRIDTFSQKVAFLCSIVNTFSHESLDSLKLHVAVLRGIVEGTRWNSETECANSHDSFPATLPARFALRESADFLGRNCRNSIFNFRHWFPIDSKTRTIITKDHLQGGVDDSSVRERLHELLTCFQSTEEIRLNLARMEDQENKPASERNCTFIPFHRYLETQLTIAAESLVHNSRNRAVLSGEKVVGSAFVLRVCNLLNEALDADVLFYFDIFSPFLGDACAFLGITANVVYRLVLPDIIAVFENTTDDSMDGDAFALGAWLCGFRKRFAQFLSPSDSVATVFSPVLPVWKRHSEKLLLGWVDEAVKLDLWVAVRGDDSNGGALHSSSVVDLGCAAVQLVRHVSEHSWALRPRDAVLFAEAVVEGAKRYMLIISKAVMREMKNFEQTPSAKADRPRHRLQKIANVVSRPSSRTGKENDSPKFEIEAEPLATPAMCAQLSNLFTIREGLVRAFESLQSIEGDESCPRPVRSVFNNFFASLLEKRTQLLTAVVDWIFAYCDMLITHALLAPQSVGTLMPALDFLGKNLERLSAGLYLKAFQFCLSQLFERFMLRVQLLILSGMSSSSSNDIAMSSMSRTALEVVLDEIADLASFFHADGVGIDGETVARRCLMLSQLVQLALADSATLVSIHKAVESVTGGRRVSPCNTPPGKYRPSKEVENFEMDLICPDHVIMILRSRTDSVATRFVATVLFK